MRRLLAALFPAALLTGCVTGHEGPASHTDAASIQVGATHEQLLAALGKPMAETVQPPGKCLDYTTLNQDGASQPFHVVLTPNERVYESGPGDCASAAVHG